MREITIDCAGLDKAGLHSAFRKALDFPQWYGNNLDALYDCLTEIFEPTHLILSNLPPLPGFLETLEDAANNNECLSVTILS